ncbi:MAG TPA: hypothetical protein VFA55_08930 [Candidatus Kapabacteria bacterium]|nr:hypothetical protein [Candidatus Kapabacteria bacterium]
MLRYKLPYLTSYPPLNSGMPFDVMVGYIYGDSLARYAGLKATDNAIANMYYADTIRELAKYMYELDDYNPVNFYLWGRTDPLRRFKWISPMYVRIQSCERMETVFPDSLRTADISWADYIADVHVNYTIEGVDFGSPGLRLHPVKVDCTVLDPIKGQVFPPPIPDNIYSAHEVKHQGSSTVSIPGDTIQFEYTMEWDRTNHGEDALFGDSTLGNIKTGARWIQPDSEYIVFLSFVGLGQDHSGAYCSLYPESIIGTNSGMYPVRDGKVYDIRNDFGFGTGLTVAQFKSALRAKIYSITHP